MSIALLRLIYLQRWGNFKGMATPVEIYRCTTLNRDNNSQIRAEPQQEQRQSYDYQTKLSRRGQLKSESNGLWS